MERSLALSILLHTGMFLLIVVGLPSLFPKDPPLPSAISVELLPVSDISNVKPSKKPISKKPPAKQPPRKKPVPKTTTSESKPEPKKPIDSVKIPDPTKKPEKKEEPPKEDPKKKEEDNPLDAVLKSVEKEAATTEEEVEKEDEGTSTATSNSDNYNPSLPLSMSERDAIKSQFVRCWRMPAGARDGYDLAVRVAIKLYPDGSLMEATLADGQLQKYQSDTFFRAATDAALRAVQLCNPIKNLPPEKYDTWKDIELNFDPRELLY